MHVPHVVSYTYMLGEKMGPVDADSMVGSWLRAPDHNTYIVSWFAVEERSESERGGEG